MSLRKGSQRRLEAWRRYVIARRQLVFACGDGDRKRIDFFFELTEKYYWSV